MKLIDLVFRMNYTLVQGSLEQDITEVIYDSRMYLPLPARRSHRRPQIHS